MEYTAKLQKPNFIKVADLQPGKHCYNIYCKVLEVSVIEKTLQRGDILKIAEGMVGDETAVVRFKLIGNHVDNLKEGSVVAFRNGKSMVIDEHILLQMDRFGKVSVEADVVIGDCNMTKNVSDEKWEKKARN